MITIIKGVFPKEASNNYHGHALALWGFALMTLATVLRSLIHIFKYDGGAQSIATIPLDTYSDAAAATVVALFAYWGVAQLLYGLLYVVVLLRYRTLIPLMYLTLFAEWGIRLFIGHYKIIETVGQAPAGIANYVLPPLMLILLYLALPKRE